MSDLKNTLKRLAGKVTGTRYLKVNLHVHGMGQDPSAVVEAARAAALDLIAITDHQTFAACDAIVAASKTSGRELTVLPGIEITSTEGAHVLSVFPNAFTGERNLTQLETICIN